ncbi:MAG: SDR family oxidoreductase [bacterium]
MKVLITGNLGYVGAGLVYELRHHYPEAEIIGYDTGFYAKYITNNSLIPESYLDAQYYADIRNFPETLLEGVDSVINLAAISNDPIGNKFEEATLDINYRAAVNLAKKSKQAGVRNYIYASSCSVYGAASDQPRKEGDKVNPLTAYAKSKIYTENDLSELADNEFKITCFRFATACGMSDRLRLDLVLNDFVAGAVSGGKITILSDGTPWRPLINVLDMARAIRWGYERTHQNGGDFLVINTGSDEWNYTVKELAMKIREILPEISVSVNQQAEPDKRSYKVDFGLFKKLAPNHQPVYDLERSINGLLNGLKQIGFNDPDFRNSKLMRLNVINHLVEQGKLDGSLRIIT